MIGYMQNTVSTCMRRVHPWILVSWAVEVESLEPISRRYGGKTVLGSGGSCSNHSPHSLPLRTWEVRDRGGPQGLVLEPLSLGPQPSVCSP